MRKKLEFQSDRIEAVLHTHRVPARVTGGTVTPRWVRFQVLPAVGAKISKIKALSEEFAAALDAPNCRVSRRGATVAIEIPRDDPQPVRLLPLCRQLDPDDVPPVTATLGLADDGAPLLIRLPSPDVAHVLVAGTTGSGKTVLLQSIILSLAMTNPSQGEEKSRGESLALVLIDPKGSAFRPFGGLPHLARPVIREVEEATEALASLVRLMERRSGGNGAAAASHSGRDAGHYGTAPTPRVVVVIDELADLLMTGGKEVQVPLTRLLQRGRGAGIHVVAATQKPSAAVLGPLLKANFPVRLVGKVSSTTDARVASGWSGTGAERLMGRGDFVVVAEGRVTRFQVAHVTTGEIREVVAGFARGAAGRLSRSENSPRSGGGLSVPSHPTMGRDYRTSPAVPIALPRPMRRLANLLMAGSDGQQTIQVAATEAEHSRVEELADRLRPWWEEHGDEWGAKSAAVRYLFGGDTPAGGTFWDLTIAAIEQVENPTSTNEKHTPRAQTGWAKAFGAR